MWCIWCERNAHTFSEEETSGPALKFSFLQALFEWSTASNLVPSNSISELLDIALFVLSSHRLCIMYTSSVPILHLFDLIL